MFADKAQEIVARLQGGGLDELSKLSATHFAFSKLSEAEESFRKEVLAAQNGDGTFGDVPDNAVVSAGLSAVRDALAEVIGAQGTVRCFLREAMPTVEDGNNFGVGVIHGISEFINKQNEWLVKCLDELPGYYKERSDVVGKLSSSTSLDTTKGSKKSTEAAEGKEEVKTTTSEGTDEKVSAKKPNSVDVAHLVAIDIKWYFKLKTMLDEVYYSAFSFADLLSKNSEKIAFPKGKGGGGGAMAMY